MFLAQSKATRVAFLRRRDLRGDSRLNPAELSHVEFSRIRRIAYSPPYGCLVLPSSSVVWKLLRVTGPIPLAAVTSMLVGLLHAARAAHWQCSDRHRRSSHTIPPRQRVNP